MTAEMQAAGDVRAPVGATIRGAAPDELANDPMGAATFCHSERIDLVIPALSRAQLVMTAPRCDAQANITPRDKDKRAYSYRYATLASVMAAVRLPLGEEGLFLMTRVVWRSDERRWVVFVQLFHQSTQWIGLEWPLPKDFSQSRMTDDGGCVTLACRYGIKTLLNLPTGDDRDESWATTSVASQQVSASFREEGRNRADELRRIHRELLALARRAAHPDQIEALLHLWLDNIHIYADYMSQSDNRQLFDQAMADVRSALHRVSDTMAEAFTEMTEARSRGDQEKVFLKFYGSRDGRRSTAQSAELAEIRKKYPRLFNEFHQHMNYFAERAVVMDPSAADDAELASAMQQAERSFARVSDADRAEAEATELRDRPDPGQVQETPVVSTPGDTPSVPDIKFPNRGGGPFDAKVFSAYLFDEQGSVAADLFTDEVAWAKAYAALWVISDDANSLQDANRGVLSNIADDSPAAAVLEAAMNGAAEPPSPEPAPRPEPPLTRMQWPLKRSGVIDVAAALKLATFAIDTCNSHPRLNAWISLNASLWDPGERNPGEQDPALECPDLLRQKIMAMILRRRKELEG